MRRAERAPRGEVAVAAEPRTLWIRVTSSASSRASGGRIDGSRRASIVLPEPGGPLEQQVMAARGGDRQRLDRRGMAAYVAEIGRRDASPGVAPRTAAGADLAAQRRREPGEVRDAEHLDAVDERRLGGALERHDEPAQPEPARALCGDERPRAGADLAAQRQLAEDREALERSAGIAPSAARIAQAIARSKPAPALRRYAGARLTVIRRCGNSKPELRIAALTRSRDSATDAVAESDDGERRKPAAQVGLDDDRPGVESVEREGRDAGEHDGER